MMFTINLLPCVCVSSHVYVLSSSLARTNPVVDASAGIWVVCLVDIGSHIHLGSMTFADDCRQLTLPIHRWAACIPIWRRCCRHCETVTAMSSSPLPSSCGFHFSCYHQYFKAEELLSSRVYFCPNSSPSTDKRSSCHHLMERQYNNHHQHHLHQVHHCQRYLIPNKSLN